MEVEIARLRLVVASDSSLPDIAKVLHSLDKIFRIFSAVHSARPSNQVLIAQLTQRVYPWNAAEGLRLHRATEGSIDLEAISQIAGSISALIHMVQWISPLVSISPFRRRDLELEKLQLEIKQLRKADEKDQAMGAYALEQARQESIRARSETFARVMETVYDPAIQRGFSSEQAGKMVEHVLGESGILVGIQERTSIVQLLEVR
jgi:hypothetical protein